jgi:uroporphyrinogen-III synthase
MPFDGCSVLSLESRRAKEIETLILRHGGVPFVAPSVKERAIQDNTVAFRFVEQLEAGDFDLIVCMTGVGLAFLRDVVITQMPVERLSAALRNATIVSRGPKPVPLLRLLGVAPDVVIPEPNTWREIVQAIAIRPERRIAVQEYGRPNLEMNAALEALGASVSQIALYRWELPDDLGPLQQAAHLLVRDAFDVVIFTSSIQLDHLLQVARDLEIERGVMAALHGRAVLASVGPVMTDSLAAKGLPADIIPQTPKMGALVKAAADGWTSVYHRKKKQ